MTGYRSYTEVNPHVASCCQNREKVQQCGPLGSRADFNFNLHTEIEISIPQITANKIEKVMLRETSKFFFQLLFGK